MKPILFSKAALVAAAMLTFFTWTGATAQITVNPYTVKNNTGCTFILNWNAVDQNCVTVCSSNSAVTIGPNAITPLSWSCAPSAIPLCDFKFLITDVGAATLGTPVAGSVLGGGATIPTPGGAGANCPNTSYNLVMQVSGAAIN